MLRRRTVLTVVASALVAGCGSSSSSQSTQSPAPTETESTRETATPIDPTPWYIRGTYLVLTAVPEPSPPGTVIPLSSLSERERQAVETAIEEPIYCGVPSEALDDRLKRSRDVYFRAGDTYYGIWYGQTDQTNVATGPPPSVDRGACKS